MPERTFFGITRQETFFMGYFDDFQLLNVTRVRNYGTAPAELILTPHYYLGVMQGKVLLNGAVEERPLVYLTPKGIITPNGWNSPGHAYRDNFYIECTGERARRLFAAFGAEKACRHFFVSDPAGFLALLSEMRRLFLAPPPLAQLEEVLCLEQFAALLERSQRYTGSGKLPRIEQIMESISANPGGCWSFRDEAARCGISLRHWNRLFTAAASLPPHRFVALCRLRLAKELLAAGKLTLKEIAGETGFEGASEFSRFFKKMCGMTPGEFRKSRMV